MDNALQDSIVAARPNNDRGHVAWLDPITLSAGAPDPLAGSTRDFLTTVARQPTERADAFWR